MRNFFFRVGSYLRHSLTACHTGGYGIHSPHLFYIARVLAKETSPYYCFRDVEQVRRGLLQSVAVVHVEDFGTGKSGDFRVCDLASRVLMPRRQAQLLFRLVQFLKPELIVELGTALGVTTAYLALPDRQARVLTFEGAGEVTKLARKTWQKLDIQNVRCVTGDLDKTLSSALEGLEQPVDFAVLDANHRGDALLRYFELLCCHTAPASVFVVDDIRYSPDMFAAWQELTRRPMVTASFDFGAFGLLFFDPHFPRKTFRLRF